MNQLTSLRESLIQQLSTINQAVGYRTNAGTNVRYGWFEEVIQTQKGSEPVIVVQRGKNGVPYTEAGELVLLPGYMIIAAVNAGLTGYDSALDDIEHDIYSALIQRGYKNIPWAPYGPHKITFDEPLHAPPGGGQNWASLAIPINFKTAIQRHED